MDIVIFMLLIIKSSNTCIYYDKLRKYRCSADDNRRYIHYSFLLGLLLMFYIYFRSAVKIIKNKVFIPYVFRMPYIL